MQEAWWWRQLQGDDWQTPRIACQKGSTDLEGKGKADGGEQAEDFAGVNVVEDVLPPPLLQRHEQKLQRHRQRLAQAEANIEVEPRFLEEVCD